MIISELEDIFYLFVDGLLIGGILSAFPFLLGYAINSIYDLIKKS